MATSVSAKLRVEGVSKEYRSNGMSVTALSDVNIEIAPGEFACLVGTSGCGKTTLLRIMAGLETDYRGDVALDGKRIAGPGVDKGVIFQEHRLLPWYSVEENIGFGLRNGERTEAGRSSGGTPSSSGWKGSRRRTRGISPAAWRRGPRSPAP